MLAVTVAALKARGRELFLIVGTTETDAHLDALTAAIAADETTVVCLTAAPETTSRRVSEREPPEWHGRDALVAHSAVLATQIPALRGIDLHVSTEGRAARDVAAEIRQASRTILCEVTIKVDVWSDIACPWCYIGKRKFEAGARGVRR